MFNHDQCLNQHSRTSLNQTPATHLHTHHRLSSQLLDVQKRSRFQSFERMKLSIQEHTGTPPPPQLMLVNGSCFSHLSSRMQSTISLTVQKRSMAEQKLHTLAPHISPSRP
jgi:hypothetical protein